MSSMSDFTMTKTDVGGDVYYTLSVGATDERLLINVNDAGTLPQIDSPSNFLL